MGDLVPAGSIDRHRLKSKHELKYLNLDLKIGTKMADIDIENVDKLKVAELRALLSSHELDTKGTKPILVARLKSYLESLPPKGEGESSPAKPVAKPVETEETPDDDEDEEAMEEEVPAKVAAPAAAVTPKKEVTKEEPAKAEEAAKE